MVPEVDFLLRVAHTLVPRAADAEDLVQDTLLRAYQGIASFDGAHPRAWLLTIMRNAEMNRTRRRRPPLLDDPEEVATVVPVGEASDPETLVVGPVFDAVVEDALGDLPVDARTIVQLVDVEGLTYAEASEALGVPLGTVMSRLHRARARIRGRLTAAGVAPRGKKAAT